MKPSILLATLVLAGCGGLQPAGTDKIPPKPFAGTKWQLQLEVPIAGEQPYVRFGDGLMEGFGGCNKVAARYVQDTVGARALVIGRIEGGFKACDARAQTAERRMLEVLQAVSSYSITADELTMSGSGGTIKFRSDPPYPPK